MIICILLITLIRKINLSLKKHFFEKLCFFIKFRVVILKFKIDKISYNCQNMIFITYKFIMF